MQNRLDFCIAAGSHRFYSLESMDITADDGAFLPGSDHLILRGNIGIQYCIRQHGTSCLHRSILYKISKYTALGYNSASALDAAADDHVTPCNQRGAS